MSEAQLQREGERRVGLIGDPVEHSLSPAFQQPAFDALRLSIRYELWPTTVEALPARLAALRAGANGALGANVTVPHKEAVFAALDDLSPIARRVGAVNTIVRRDGCLYGDNTDVYGFGAPLRELAFDFARGRAVVLGAGGAARGVVVALLDSGAACVTIANRTLSRASALADAVNDARVDVCRLDEVAQHSGETTLLVNATALGWADDALPCGPELFGSLAAGALAYDLTYRDTAFLRAAASAGVATLDGLAMLVHQGARAFELWSGRDAPLTLMWDAARRARAADS